MVSNMPKLQIIFKEDGTTEVKAVGFSGKKCVEVSDEIMKTIGGKPEKRVLTEDYYKTKTSEKTAVRV